MVPPEVKKLFDDEEGQKDLVLEMDSLRKGAQKEEVKRRWVISRELLEELADKWQIPLLLFFIFSFLFIVWALRKSISPRTVVGVRMDTREARKERSSTSHILFEKARREAMKVELTVAQMENPAGVDASDAYLAFLDNFDTAAMKGDDRFLLNRLGDAYVRSVIDRNKVDDGRHVASIEIAQALRWVGGSLEEGGALRSKVELLTDRLKLHEEYSDRLGSRTDYEKGLEYLDDLVAEDPGSPRHYDRARLHFKAGDDEHFRAAREFIEASLASRDPFEVENRFHVRTLKGKILAAEGQVEEAERIFESILNDASGDIFRADTLYHLGQMRSILARRSEEDGSDPLPWYHKAGESYEQAWKLYKEVHNPTDAVAQRREEASFHIGTLRMREALRANPTERQPMLMSARDLFNRLSQRVRMDAPMLHAVNIRRAQVNTELGKGAEAERLVDEIMEDYEERYWDRTKLITSAEVEELIGRLADVHERNKDYLRQIAVLSHLEKFLDKGDKQGRIRSAVAIARAYENQALANPGPGARESRRKSAEEYIRITEGSVLKFNRSEKGDLLWSAYLQYKACFDPANIQLWSVRLEERDIDSAIAVLDKVVELGDSPRTNARLNEALYLKGLHQEDLRRLPEAIFSHEQNIGTQAQGGDNIFLYQSYLRRAIVRAMLGGTDNIAKAIVDCDELLKKREISPDAAPWEEALFLHGDLNIHMGMRSKDQSQAQKSYLEAGVRSLDEALARYPTSPHQMRSRVNNGLAKFKLGKLDPLNSMARIKGAIDDLSAAERQAHGKVLTPEQRNLKKRAMMNLGLAYLELEGNNYLEAALTFDRLARAFRRDKVEPWALIQLHRAYRNLAQITANSGSGQGWKAGEYLQESRRAADKALASWEQVSKLTQEKFPRDFPLSYWEEADRWLLTLESEIDNLRRELGRT
ncbi:MAG: tetratricopeptide repeat protein [Planctomycetota bacterium]